MKPGFMSSVCPDKTVDELIASAKRYEFQGIELRVEWGHRHGVELDTAAAAIAEARRKFEDSGISVTCIATSVKLNSEDAAERRRQLETLRRYIGLAAAVGAPNVRIFGDPVPDEPDKRAACLSWEAEFIAQADPEAVEQGVLVCLETHGNMLGRYAGEILKQAQAKNARVLWHAGHHLRRGESVDEAYEQIRGLVRHLHWSEQEPATRTEDNRRSMELLLAEGFDGYFSVEVINPEDSEAVLERHREAFKAHREALGF